MQQQTFNNSVIGPNTIPNTQQHIEIKEAPEFRIDFHDFEPSKLLSGAAKTEDIKKKEKLPDGSEIEKKIADYASMPCSYAYTRDNGDVNAPFTFTGPVMTSPTGFVSQELSEGKIGWSIQFMLDPTNTTHQDFKKFLKEFHDAGEKLMTADTSNAAQMNFVYIDGVGLKCTSYKPICYTPTQPGQNGKPIETPGAQSSFFARVDAPKKFSRGQNIIKISDGNPNPDLRVTKGPAEVNSEKFSNCQITCIPTFVIQSWVRAKDTKARIILKEIILLDHKLLTALRHSSVISTMTQEQIAQSVTAMNKVLSIKDSMIIATKTEHKEETKNTLTGIKPTTTNQQFSPVYQTGITYNPQPNYYQSIPSLNGMPISPPPQPSYFPHSSSYPHSQQ